MGGASVDGRNGEFIRSVSEMLVRFSVELGPDLKLWESRLLADPDELEAVEREVANRFSRGAGLIVAGLVSVVMQTKEFEARREAARSGYGVRLGKGREQKMAIRILGGLVMWVTSLYCEPAVRRGTRKDGTEAESAMVSGFHVEQSLFGFGKKISPGLESRVARQTALGPSYDLACRELNRYGLELNVKTVRRVSQQCGEKLLNLRTSDLELWREGKLESTGELAGKRVSVQLDGGRTKLRKSLRAAVAHAETLNADGLVISDAPGRSKKQPRRSFDSDWREPKLMTIFIHDEKGRLEKKTRMTIDGTFMGPDAMTELVAMHLQRLGASQALSITFVSDGAVWIWDRVETIVKQANIPEQVTIYQVLDNCHAAHHVSLALAAMGLSATGRMPLYRSLRSQLRDGQWQSVVDTLQSLLDDEPDNEALQTELNYLRRHGEAGRLDYTRFRDLGLPLGSGAIESSIRRVINLRLKGNGIFWLEDHAEEMLQLRANLITDRWDDQLRRSRAWHRKNQMRSWRWDPKPMSKKVECDSPITQNSA